MDLRLTDPNRYRQSEEDYATLMELLGGPLGFDGTNDDHVAIVLMLSQVSLYSLGVPPSTCAVCDAKPAESWRDLMRSGVHCPEHREAYHAACGAPHFCCPVPVYNPDHDYEWRPARQPQE
jgi:hypothetical protein